jgi:hypothetical protein
MRCERQTELQNELLFSTPRSTSPCVLRCFLSGVRVAIRHRFPTEPVATPEPLSAFLWETCGKLWFDLASTKF